MQGEKSQHFISRKTYNLDITSSGNSSALDTHELLSVMVVIPNVRLYCLPLLITNPVFDSDWMIQLLKVDYEVRRSINKFTAKSNRAEVKWSVLACIT